MEPNVLQQFKLFPFCINIMFDLIDFIVHFKIKMEKKRRKREAGRRKMKERARDKSEVGRVRVRKMGEREEVGGEDDREKFEKTLKTRSNKTRQEQVQSKQYNPRHSI